MVTVLPAGFIEPCIPTRAAKPPAGLDWVHEIKHDGHRLIVRREGTDRYPAIRQRGREAAREVVHA
jgi:ATP-dependent DNA ligase